MFSDHDVSHYIDKEKLLYNYVIKQCGIGIQEPKKGLGEPAGHFQAALAIGVASVFVVQGALGGWVCNRRSDVIFRFRTLKGVESGGDLRENFLSSFV